MGSPVSVTIANLVMEEIEEQALQTCQPQPRFWKKYVDETIAVYGFVNLLAFFPQPSHPVHIEKESDGYLPF